MFQKEKVKYNQGSHKTGPKVDLGLCHDGALSGLMKAVFMDQALQSPCWGESMKFDARLEKKCEQSFLENIMCLKGQCS